MGQAGLGLEPAFSGSKGIHFGSPLGLKLTQTTNDGPSKKFSL